MRIKPWTTRAVLPVLLLVSTAGFQGAPEVEVVSILAGVNVVVIIGGVWALASRLSRIDERLAAVSKLPHKVEELVVAYRLLENDVNALWEAVRGEPVGRSRRPTHLERGE